MPSFRGIEVSILTQSLIGRLPEYPHPDGFCFQEHCTGEDPQDDQPVPCVSDLKHTVENQPAKDPTSSPRISVYVPSVPGSQFWIRYIVEHEHSLSSHLFFKLHMNGRHITSWGINPRIKNVGQVEKALYEPCDRWDQEEDGVIFKPEGIEARYFYFVSDNQQLSIAADGGLIEVHVFRAKGRKRRAAKLDQYRQMDRYGITAPSGGLVDNPQDVTFFDFHLIDPKDKPFATFCFHYRSLENLHRLNLIPTNDPNTLFPSPGSAAKRVIDSISKGSFTILEDESCSEDRPEPSRQEPFETVFDDSSSSVPQTTPLCDETKPRCNSSYMLRTPPQLRPRSASSQTLPQPSKALRDALPPGFPESYLLRPLPDLPLPEHPAEVRNDKCAYRSRKSSTASAAPSIAPSLLSYVKNESYTEEDVQYGQASTVPIDKDHPGVPLNQETLSTLTSEAARAGVFTPVNVSETSLSNYEVSPLTTDDSKEREATLLSPCNYLATTGGQLDQHVIPLEHDQASPDGGIESTSDIKSPRIKRADTRDLALDLARFPQLQLSASEWPRPIVSPQHAPRKMLSPRLGRLWHTLRRNKSRSPTRTTRDETASRNNSTPHLLGSEGKEAHGKWI